MHQLLEKTKALRQDTFVRHNMVFFVGSGVVALLNYLYHPVLSRMMSVEDFGETQVLLAIFTQISIVFIAFGTVAIHLVSNSENDKAVRSIMVQLQTVAFLLVGVMGGGAILVLSPFLKDLLQFESVYPFFALAVTLPLAVPFIFYRGYLQGRNRFQAASISNSIVAGGRLVFAVLFVFLGLKVFGAVVALAAAYGVAWAYSAKKTGFLLPFSFRLRFDALLQKELLYGLLILVANGFITLLYTADVVVVKYFFSPEVAGLYSGISAVARVLFFGTSSVALVLLSSVKARNTFAENNKMLQKALVLISIIGGGALLVFWLLPELVTVLLVGKAYLEFAHLLPLVSLFVFFASVANLVFWYFLALRNYAVIGIAAMGAVLLFLLVALFHGTLLQVVSSFVAASAITTAFAFGLYAFSFFKNRTVNPSS